MWLTGDECHSHWWPIVTEDKDNMRGDGEVKAAKAAKVVKVLSHC